MKTNSKRWLAVGLAAALVTLTACSGGSDSSVAGGGGTGTGTSSGPGTVPDSAGTSGAGFIAYLKGLSPNDETSEPLLIKDSFAVPADEAEDPAPLA